MGNVERYFCVNAILGLPEKPLITLIKLYLSGGSPIELFAEKHPSSLRLLPFVRKHKIEEGFELPELLLFSEQNSGKILRLFPNCKYLEFAENNRATLEKNYIIVR